MKTVLLKTVQACLAFCSFLPVGFGQIQCDIDVEIIEGDTIEMCSNALVPVNATSGYVDYAWTGSSTGAAQSFIPTASGQHIVFAEDAIGCISSDTIEVIVHSPPTDNIISSAGDTLCNVASSTLSLSGSYSLYSWTGGVTTPTLDVSTSGTYTVSVVDANDCVSTFSYDIEVFDFQVNVISQNSCNNTQTIQATGGSQYSWSTGETSNTIVVAPEETAFYDVTISEGSCVANLSITLDPIGSDILDFSLPDTFYVEAGNQLTVYGPPGFDTFLWTPGNQLQDSTSSSATFVGTETQTITMTAVHPDGCVIQETFVVVVVDVTVPDGFSPNGDMINDFFVIPELTQYRGKIVIWNRWGDIVFESDDYQNDWSGTCETGFCFPNSGMLPDGTYFYHLDIGGIEKEGYITLIR
jgi:gliding motility-associated-like protein